MRNLIVVMVIFFLSLAVFLWAIFYTPKTNSFVEEVGQEPKLNESIQKEDLTRYFLDDANNVEETALEIEEEGSCILFGEITSTGTVSSNTVCLPVED